MICRKKRTDEERIKAALRIKESAKFLPARLKRADLESIARFTNGAFFHYSGNCTLLSTCLYFNLSIGRKILSVHNISSPLLGLDSTITEEIILGAKMIVLDKTPHIANVTTSILREYASSGRLYFKVDVSGYHIPVLGESGHELNAVVINEGISPTVVYVDAWKTSEHITNEKTLAKRYGAGAVYQIKILPYFSIHTHGAIHTRL